MKTFFPFLTLTLGFLLTVTAQAGSGVLDLTTLANYAVQPIPAYITRTNTTAGNAITDKGATLGRVLFYDKRLSKDNTIACASCHQQAHAFGDPATASTGVAGTTTRHAMRLVDARFAQEVKFFWDERAATLEAQTTQPIQNHVEMGFSGTSGDQPFSALVTKLFALDEYRVLFMLTFGTTSITEARVQLALAQFVRSIQSFDSRFDKDRATTVENLPFANFTAQENNGKALFVNPPPGGAGCAGCHVPPEFGIDPNSRNNGVITQIGGGTDLTNTRSPSLRDLLNPSGVPNTSFMHDGSFATLAQVVNHYNLIPADNANLDPRLRRPGGQPQSLQLTQQQKNDLAAFLGTLTGTAVYTDAKWSDPFNAQGQLTLIVLPANTITIVKNANGTTAKISCKAAPGLQYQLSSSIDLTNWTPGITVTPNASGICEQIVTLSGKKYFRYAYPVP